MSPKRGQQHVTRASLNAQELSSDGHGTGWPAKLVASVDPEDPVSLRGPRQEQSGCLAKFTVQLQFLPLQLPIPPGRVMATRTLRPCPPQRSNKSVAGAALVVEISCLKPSEL